MSSRYFNDIEKKLDYKIFIFNLCLFNIFSCGKKNKIHKEKYKNNLVKDKNKRCCNSNKDKNFKNNDILDLNKDDVKITDENNKKKECVKIEKENKKLENKKNKDEINNIIKKLKEEIEQLKNLLDNYKDNIDDYANLDVKIENLIKEINEIKNKEKENIINSKIINFKGEFLSKLNSNLSTKSSKLFTEIEKYNNRNILGVHFVNIEYKNFNIISLTEKEINDNLAKYEAFKKDFNDKKKTFINTLIKKLKEKITEYNNKHKGKQIKNIDENNEIKDIDDFIKIKDKVDIEINTKLGTLKDLYDSNIQNLKNLSKKDLLNSKKEEISKKIQDFKKITNPNSENVKELQEYIKNLEDELNKIRSDEVIKNSFIIGILKKFNSIANLNIEELNNDKIQDKENIENLKQQVTIELENFIKSKNTEVERYIKKYNSLVDERSKKKINDYKLDEVKNYINFTNEESCNNFITSVEKIKNFKDSLLKEIDNTNIKIKQINSNVDNLNKIELKQDKIEDKCKVNEISKTEENLIDNNDYSITINYLNNLKKYINENVNIINKILILLNKDIKIEYNNDKLTILNEELSITNVKEKINFKNEKTLDDLIDEKNKEIKDFCKFLLNREVNDEEKINNIDSCDEILKKLKIFNIDKKNKNVVNTNVDDFFYINKIGEIELEKEKKNYDYFYFEFIENKKFKIYCYLYYHRGRNDDIYFVFDKSYFYIKNIFDKYINNILKHTGFGFVKIKMKLLKKYDNNNIIKKCFENNIEGKYDKYGKSKDKSFYLNLKDGYIYTISLDKNKKITKEKTEIKYENIKDYVSFEGRTTELEIQK